MYNVSVSFNILEFEVNESPPVDYSKSSGHPVFDVEIDFTYKVRWVKDLNKNQDTKTSSYASVVSYASIRIMMTHAA